MSTLSVKKERRVRRKLRVRKKIHGTAEAPRLTVYRSNKHLYAQIINDETHQTLVFASTLSPELDQNPDAHCNLKGAALVGALLAKKALEQKITAVRFDRNGYLYHGRVKALADAARENGLKF